MPEERALSSLCAEACDNARLRPRGVQSRWGGYELSESEDDAQELVGDDPHAETLKIMMTWSHWTATERTLAERSRGRCEVSLNAKRAAKKRRPPGSAKEPDGQMRQLTRLPLPSKVRWKRRPSPGCLRRPEAAAKAKSGLLIAKLKRRAPWRNCEARKMPSVVNCLS